MVLCVALTSNGHVKFMLVPPLCDFFLPACVSAPPTLFPALRISPPPHPCVSLLPLVN